VTAENAARASLIPNRYDVGGWEQFDSGNGYAALIARANGKLVTADNGGNSPLIANRTSVGTWELFFVVTMDELN